MLGIAAALSLCHSIDASWRSLLISIPVASAPPMTAAKRHTPPTPLPMSKNCTGLSRVMLLVSYHSKTYITTWGMCGSHHNGQVAAMHVARQEAGAHGS